MSTPQQPGQGIAITSKRLQSRGWGWGRLYPAPPGIFINGRPSPNRGWERTFHPLPPGRYHIHVFVPVAWSLKTHGPADYVAHVHPGQVLELEYAPPYTYGSPGLLGPGPQQPIGEDTYNRMMAITAILVAALLVVVVGGIGGLLLLEKLLE